MSIDTNTYDVLVVGGGPAGAIAAYELAKSKVSVALIEKEKLPRYKACGGIVTPRVDRIIDFSLEPVIERHISKMLITVKQSSPFVREYPRTIVYTMMRDTFDNFLVQKAREAGAIVFDGSPLTALEALEDGYRVKTPTGEFVTKYVIAADGANSITRRLVGAPKHQRLSVAIEREILDTENRLDEWNSILALDFGHMKSGYGWVFPKANNFSVGVGAPKSLARELRPYYDSFVDHYAGEIGNTEPYISEGHHLPIRVHNEKIVYGRTVFVGDVAGLIDPMTGEGIYFAMRSGQFAAQVIEEALRIKSNDLRKYEELVDREIQSELQVAKILLKILDTAPGFWVPLLLKRSNMFWNYFCRVLIGEKTYHV